MTNNRPSQLSRRALLCVFVPSLACFVAAMLVPVGATRVAADERSQSDVSENIERLIGELGAGWNRGPDISHRIPTHGSDGDDSAGGDISTRGSSIAADEAASLMRRSSGGMSEEELASLERRSNLSEEELESLERRSSTLDDEELEALQRRSSQFDEEEEQALLRRSSGIDTDAELASLSRRSGGLELDAALLRRSGTLADKEEDSLLRRSGTIDPQISSLERRSGSIYTDEEQESLFRRSDGTDQIIQSTLSPTDGIKIGSNLSKTNLSDDEADLLLDPSRIDSLSSNTTLATTSSNTLSLSASMSTQSSASNPRSGEPIRVVHIDPDASEDGDGTFENPFNSLASYNALSESERASYDIVYIHPREDGTDTNLDSGIELLAHQRMLSTTASHTVDTQFGTFDLPGMEVGPAPVVSNRSVGGDVIVLGAFSEVSGFTIDAIDGASGSGIVGTGLTGFNINRNDITNGVHGVSLTTSGESFGIFENNTVSNNTIDGFNLVHSGSGTLSLGVLSNTADGNGGTGFSITAEGSTINLASAFGGVDFEGNTATGNGTGAHFGASAGGTINLAASGNVFDDNIGAATGVSFTADGAGSSINVSSFTNNSVSGNVNGDGVGFGATGGGTIGMSNVTGNTIGGNGVNGIGISATGAGSSVDVSIGVSGGTANAISGNGTTGNGHGIGIEASEGASVGGSIVNNDIDNQTGGSAINIEADSATINFGDGTDGRSIAENSMEGNTGGGVVAMGTNDSDLDFFINENSIGTSASINGGVGIGVTGDGGTLDLVATNNQLGGNTGAGIAYTQIQSAVGSFTITGNTITGTEDDGDFFSGLIGEGISIRQIGGNTLFSATNVLTDAVIDDNTIGSLTDLSLGNAGHGISIETRENSTLTNLMIGDDDGDDDSGNIVAGNGTLGVDADGIRFRRTNNAVVDNVRIMDNQVSLNLDDGLAIQAANTADDEVDVHVEDNIVTANGGDGFALLTQADARLNINIIDNRIDDNLGDGIQTGEQINDITDRRFITGNWNTNTITGNMQHGINSNGATSGLQVGAIGVDAEGKDMRNLIDLNGFDGVEINSAGSATYTNNIITRNGLQAMDDPTQGGGIDIQGATSKNLTFNLNVVRNNLGDGLEIANNSDLGAISVSAIGNVIRDNTGRGVDILNQDEATSFVNLSGNGIIGNGLEGVFIVNTSSATQGQVGSIASATELAADGDFDDNPNLGLSITGNTIQSNGELSDFQGTGLVMLVGTSGGGYGFTDPGGFADSGRGGIIADVSDNSFGGNFGVDAYIQSFVSTVDPPATDGTWSDTEFEIDSFEGDPLARLDLRFSGNTGDSLNVTPSFDVDANGSLAFYENDEATFKSRDVDETDPGPFESGDRRRNAQRLAARFDLPPDTPGGTSDTFLYSGIGQSTFRVDQGTGNSFVGGTGFILDDPVFDSVGDANGASFTDPDFGESPFGWTDFSF